MVDPSTSWDSSKLEKLLLFRGVDFRSLRGVLEECPMRVLQPEEILIGAGEHNDTLYLLLSGRLRMHFKLEAEPITILNEGEVVGELSLLDNQLTEAHVVADQTCNLLVLDEETMWSLLDASPVARNLLFLLARRVRHGDALLISSQQLQKQYERHATTDALTGLYNRRWLNRTLGRQMERSRHDDTGLALLLIDVDSFKGYNDTQGHVAVYSRTDRPRKPASRRSHCSTGRG
jgi:CRP-like cAMP-binding protein